MPIDLQTALEFQLLLGPTYDALTPEERNRLAAYQRWATENPQWYKSISAPCFAPSENHAYGDAITMVRRAIDSKPLNPDLPGEFRIRNQWSVTATNGQIQFRGDSMSLTWSYLPDGTAIDGFAGEPASPSIFIATFNALLGPPTTAGDFTTAPWHQIFVEAFAAWSSRTGLRIVYEPNDDGVPQALSPGALGVRGDIRVGGHSIDGQAGSNTLAYNFFPNFGDMVIDTDNTLFYGLGQANNGTYNVLAHELGHGLGFSHVLPTSQTKLMEPFVSLAFRGPQEDDYLAGNRNYGNGFESDDPIARARPTGVLTENAPFNIINHSIDGTSDLDYYQFTLAAPGTLTAVMTPIGSTYLEGPQSTVAGVPDPAPTLLNTRTLADLYLRLRDGTGAVVLATAAANPAGVAEQITIPLAAGSYILLVGTQTALDNVQMYTLDVSVAGTTLPVELVDFNASTHDCGEALVEWTTATEINNDRFVVSRSVDGETWTEVGTIAAKGAGDYSFKDLTATGGVAYYKLNQYDLDGTESDFAIISVQGEACPSALTIGPNPSDGRVAIDLAAVGDIASIKVYDQLGRETYFLTGADVQATGGRLDLSHLSAGSYRVVGTGSSATYVSTLVIR